MNDTFHHQILNKVKNLNRLFEIAYQGNVGIHEMCKFFQMATPDEVKRFEVFMELGDEKSAWDLLQQVVGVRLYGLDNTTCSPTITPNITKG